MSDQPTVLPSAKREVELESALLIAENALDQNVIMCARAKNAGIDHAGPLGVVTAQALETVRLALFGTTTSPVGDASS